MLLASLISAVGMFGAPAYALAPPNDNLANATLLTPRGGEVFVAGTNSQATLQPQEPSSPVGPFKSVWYRIAAPSVGTTLDITTDGSSFDTTLVVYRGNPAGGFLKLSYVDDDDDGGDVGLGSRITAVVPDSSGLDYLIAVDGLNGASGDIYLSADVTPPPPANDNFANSQLVTVPTGGVTVAGSNLGATRQTDEPTGHGDEKSVWYRIDPAAAGKGIRITSAGTDFSPSLAVYRGTYAAGVSSLQLVDVGSRIFDDLGDYEQIEFVIPTGSSDSYFLALGSFEDSGAIQLGGLFRGMASGTGAPAQRIAHGRGHQFLREASREACAEGRPVSNVMSRPGKGVFQLRGRLPRHGTGIGASGIKRLGETRVARCPGRGIRRVFGRFFK